MRGIKEFQERFNRYNNGEFVSNIYVLPKYGDGKNSFSDEEAMDYILQLENPNRVGFSKGIWRPPTDSTKYDIHQIGGGLDMREDHNPIVYNFLKSKGRLNNPYLTETEERDLRMWTWKSKRDLMDKFVKAHEGQLSQLGYNTAAGMLWHGHPFKKMNQAGSITGKALSNAIASGDKDLTSVFDTYYGYGDNAKRFASRINANAKYRKNYKPVIQPKVVENGGLVQQLKQQEQFQPWSNYHSPDYSLNDPLPASISSWNRPESPAYTPAGLFSRKINENIHNILINTIEDYEWNPMAGFKNGKYPIHIKHPGRLTALKKRTGKSEAELYNDGNPAHKKMVVFARNARKWKK